MIAPKSAVLERLYRLAPRGALLGLDRVSAACDRLGHPERAFASVHIAGTNGKGSVAAMTAAMAYAETWRVGLYISPHLCCFNERIQIGGKPVGEDLLLPTLAEILDQFPELTFFETATVTAFALFARQGVEIGVVEVGLGGRLDATNVLEAPRATAITAIGIDHTDRLGEGLVAIAREKAGILKQGVPVVIGPLDPVPFSEVTARAQALGAPMRLVTGDIELAEFVERHPPRLEGAHQIDNAKVAVALAREVGISDRAIARGLADVHWPGRLEMLHTPRGDVLLDAAHNPDGARALAAALRARGVVPSRVALVFGAMADKDYAAMLALLAPVADHRVYLAPEGRRAADPASLARHVTGAIAKHTPHALDLGRRAVGPDGLVVVAGSIFLVGAARAYLLDLPRDPAVAL